MSSPKKFRLLLMVFVAGLALGQYMAWPYILVLCIAAAVGIYFFSRLRRMLFFGCLLIFLVAFLRVSFLEAEGAGASAATNELFDRKIVILVQVKDQPRPSGQAIDFDAKTLSVQGSNGAWKKAYGIGVRIRAASWQEIKLGDNLLFEGKFKRPANFSDFDYVAYLGHRGIQALAYYPKLTWLSNDAQFWKRWIANLRTEIEYRINGSLPEPHASLLSGLLVGARRSFPSALKQDFQTTGLTHIVAVSGSNVAMVLAASFFLFQWLPGALKMLFSSLVIIGFALLTGAEASIVRAAIMGVISLFAISCGRKGSSFTALLIAAAIMLWLSPKLVWFDAGFQLSFAATLGLLFLTKPIERLLFFVPAHLELRTIIACTLAAQITAGPVAAYHFNNFSLIAPVANVFALPWVPASMFAGAIMIFLSCFGFLPSWLIGGPVWLLLSPIIKVAQCFSRIPLASITVSRAGALAILIFFCLIVFLLTAVNGWRNEKRPRVARGRLPSMI